MPYQDPPAEQPSIVREEPHTGVHAELIEARKVLEAYDQKIDGVEAERDALKDELEQLKGQLADLDGLHTSLQAEHDKLKDEVSKAKPADEEGE